MIEEGKLKLAEPGFGYELETRSPEGHARAGRVRTPHGEFETPVFMPVGTQATVKGLLPRDIEDTGAQIILSNAYHLYIRPGIDIIKKLGGLHRFMGWNRPILTDSGGYQVFSLSRLRQIAEEGVRFHSHFDGREIFLTPESVMEIQEALGSDIAMIFDECPPPTRDKERVKKACGITYRWAQRAKKRHRLPGQALFGIVQGGIFPDLRRESLDQMLEIGFDGYALGGLCVGESKEDTRRVLQEIVPRMPEDKPRYMMGVGTPIDFLEAVDAGADMFDCVNPTRYGRNGTAFTATGLCVVRNGKYNEDPDPIEEGCACYACRHFSKGYLRHLFNAEEMLGPQLVSIHNVHFFVTFLKKIREAILAGTFRSFQKNFLNNFDPECR
ncbi:MAG TPA: tRNA guanosine(34) transglycosylase Tgt [Verrucomicrobiae bacterium]|jgi:queuine tRNA-ribosyltransferase|nr:tRNA guanosine(34) transglycosylase Tgt [Verrucomicrobiae bacterium]